MHLGKRQKLHNNAFAKSGYTYIPSSGSGIFFFFFFSFFFGGSRSPSIFLGQA